MLETEKINLILENSLRFHMKKVQNSIAPVQKVLQHSLELTDVWAQFLLSIFAKELLMSYILVLPFSFLTAV